MSTPTERPTLDKLWPGRRYVGWSAVDIARDLSKYDHDSHPFRAWPSPPVWGHPEPYPGACGSCRRPESDHPFPWMRVVADGEVLGRLVRAVLAEVSDA